MEISFRSAERAELADVLTLWREAEAEPTSTDDLESLERLLARDRDALILATCGGGLAGSVIAAWDGWRGSVYRLAVSPAFRRRGLASQLVERAERRLAALGAVRLHAIVMASDPRATGFWRAGHWAEQDGQIRFTTSVGP